MHIFADKVPPLNLQSLNPLHVQEMVIMPASSGISLIVKDYDIYGSHLFEPHRFKWEWHSFSIILIPNRIILIFFTSVIEHGKEYEMFGRLPHMYMNGTYTIDGSFLLFQLAGTGTITSIIGA